MQGRLAKGSCSVAEPHHHECEPARRALGNNSTTTSFARTQVEGLSSGATAVAVGSSHSCAVADGGVKCWGGNAYGQLGNNSTIDSAIPVPVQNLTTGVTAICAAAYHTCALRDGGAYCWGDSGRGELGINSTTISPTPVQVHGLTLGVTTINR